MNEAFVQALQLTEVALPTMLVVTVVFIIATKLLMSAFPYKAEEGEED